MVTVIFACVHNAGRSQMAAAFFNRAADPQKARALSAGTEPGRRVHPEVLETMAELGLDLSHTTPRLLTEELSRSAQFLVTMGCGEACPLAPPTVIRLDWPLPDPKGQPVERVRQIRDEIAARIDSFVEEQKLCT